MLKKLYEYRELLKSNIKKEIRGKYKGSFLGVLWSFINPLLQALVYAIVFPYVLKTNQDNYVVFIILGIIPWNFFITTIAQGTTTILQNAGIIKKVYFPREILPISVATSALVNFLISCIIMFIFVIVGGIGISPYILLLPLIIITQYIFSLGIIFITSAINVYIRDAEYIINFGLNMLFYATPVLYSTTLFENSSIKWLIELNPMTHIITCYRDILFYKSPPHFKRLLGVFIISSIILIIGVRIFKKLEKGFAEEV